MGYSSTDEKEVVALQQKCLAKVNALLKKIGYNIIAVSLHPKLSTVYPDLVSLRPIDDHKYYSISYDYKSKEFYALFSQFEFRSWLEASEYIDKIDLYANVIDSINREFPKACDQMIKLGAYLE